MTCDMRSLALMSATLGTWLRYVTGRLHHSFDNGIGLRTTIRSFVIAGEDLHTARPKYADTTFPYTFNERFQARQGRGSGSSEVCHDSDRLCKYIVAMVHVVCRGLLARQPWALPMS